MAKVELPLPNRYHFKTEIPIRKTDLWGELHVSFATVLDLVLEAHLQFFQYLGFSVLDIYGRSIIFSNATVTYESELLFGDLVEARVTIENLREKSFELFFHLTKDHGNISVSRVRISVLFFDYEARRVVPIPQEFLQLIQAKDLDIQNTSEEMRKFGDVYKKFPLWISTLKILKNVYSIANDLPDKEQEFIANGLRKYAVKAVNASAKARKSPFRKEKLKSLDIVKACLNEIRYFLSLAEELNYGKYTDLNVLFTRAEELWKVYYKKVKEAPQNLNRSKRT
ncbi:thioesterase-like family protein [Leptospira ryugenii]|uniref:Thioesterase-like family protein n=1 Tax=Leptospira ryugenii TaxID=1917863 RepID=A0A2P2E1X5_9LEPT|nr:four helix bundle protein [Leptospira ryugenii]GBF50905.1 thioesterase-like family protein [Leptospira ryugenii]